jgi:hypothetical protein
MEAYGHLAMLMKPDQTLIVVEAVNVGNKKTTITRLFACYYPTRWHRMIRREARVLIVTPSPVLAQGLPFELEPGAQWIGATYQSKDVEQMSREGYLLVGMYHSVSESPIFRRLTIASA